MEIAFPTWERAVRRLPALQRAAFPGLTPADRPILASWKRHPVIQPSPGTGALLGFPPRLPQPCRTPAPAAAWLSRDEETSRLLSACLFSQNHQEFNIFEISSCHSPSVEFDC